MMSKKIGISLAGGAARGIAHIGVLQALEENGISPQFVSGASAGSIVGALYAAGKSPGEILHIFKTTSLLRLFKIGIPTVGLSDLGNLKKILANHISIDSFESLERRLFVSVTNMTQGRYEIASEGPLFDWIVASCSIPILFSSRTLNDQVYVDGGLLNNLPIEPLKERCDIVIGVNVTPIDKANELGDLLRLSSRTLELVLWANVESRLKQCDLIIQPQADDYALFELNRADEIYQHGYEATLGQLPSLRQLLDQQNPSPRISLPSFIPSASSIRRPSLSRIINKASNFGLSKKVEAATTANTVNLPPGTLFYVGRQRIGPIILSAIDYNAESITERGNLKLEELHGYVSSENVTWVNVDGVHDTDSIGLIAEYFGLHPITAEDIVQTRERPKIDINEDYIYLNLKMISLLDGDENFDLEQVSLVLSNKFVLCFQEKSEDILEPLRIRIRQAAGRIRRKKADYLFYAIIDVIVSNYFVVIEAIDKRVEKLEVKVDKEQHDKLLEEIQAVKKGLVFLKHAVSPLKMAIEELVRVENEQIDAKNLPYFRDLTGQLAQVNEQIEAQRAVLDTLREQYLSMSSHRANEIMKVLTIVATFFIPLTFITGLYGMNFNNMPELQWKYGYAMVWGLIVISAGGLLLYFRRKKWL
jgi:magnesium transporter